MTCKAPALPLRHGPLGVQAGLGILHERLGGRAADEVHEVRGDAESLGRHLIQALVLLSFLVVLVKGSYVPLGGLRRGDGVGADLGRGVGLSLPGVRLVTPSSLSLSAQGVDHILAVIQLLTA